MQHWSGVFYNNPGKFNRVIADDGSISKPVADSETGAYMVASTLFDLVANNLPVKADAVLGNAKRRWPNIAWDNPFAQIQSTLLKETLAELQRAGLNTNSIVLLAESYRDFAHQDRVSPHIFKLFLGFFMGEEVLS